jgi:hypothetical protein
LSSLGICGRYPSIEIAAPFNKVLPTIGKFPKRPPVRDLHLTFRWQQAEVIQNHDNDNVCSIGQGEAPHRKYKRLKLGGGQAYDHSSV